MAEAVNRVANTTNPSRADSLDVPRVAASQCSVWLRTWLSTVQLLCTTLSPFRLAARSSPTPPRHRSPALAGRSGDAQVPPKWCVFVPNLLARLTLFQSVDGPNSTESTRSRPSLDRSRQMFDALTRCWPKVANLGAKLAKTGQPFAHTSYSTKFSQHRTKCGKTWATRLPSRMYRSLPSWPDSQQINSAQLDARITSHPSCIDLFQQIGRPVAALRTHVTHSINYGSANRHRNMPCAASSSSLMHRSEIMTLPCACVPHATHDILGVPAVQNTNRTKLQITKAMVPPCLRTTNRRTQLAIGVSQHALSFTQ